MNKNLIILIISLGIFLFACKTKKAVATNVESAETKACSEKVTFETLQPLLAKSCTTGGCHDEGKKRMNFKVYAQLKSFGERGEIKEHVLEMKNMPPQQKLSGEELRQFRCWIEGGMLEK
jgi:hypothetical protein